jgi:HEPN domain-containing protein
VSTAPYNASDAGSHAEPLVAEWLRKAVGDLQTAERELAVTEHPNLDAVSFHAQQGAEKLLKAALQYTGLRPPKVHDLVHLNALVQNRFPAWSFPVLDLSELSSAAVEARYPGCSSNRQDAERNLDIATRLWSALRSRL